jgi:phosphate transport system permease protein
MKGNLSSRIFKENTSIIGFFLLTVLSASIILIILFGLLIKSSPLLLNKNIASIFFSFEWKPLQQKFGLLPFIIGTVDVTILAALIAVPLSILTSIFLSEYANEKFQELATTMIDLLAGIPSVVYGIWGVVFIVPFIKNYIAPIFKVNTTGYTVLAGGIVLAVMIFPVIIQISYEVIKSVPFEIREVSLALGATKWETVKCVVFKKALPGIIAAIILGISRAFGETMAVLMVVGNVIKIPKSIFDPAYPLTALIANNYGEMMSIKLYDSALMLSGLALLIVILFFNLVSRMILSRINRY